MGLRAMTCHERIHTFYCFFLVLLLSLLCTHVKADGKDPFFQDYQHETSLIVPIPQSIKIDLAKARLGKLLFEDKRISKGDKKACVECHLPHLGGVDNEPLSMAINDKPRTTNTPTIFNAGLLPMLGWRGTGTSLEDVTEAVIKSEMGLAMNWPELIEKLNAIPAYQKNFTTIFKKTIEPAHVKEVIAEYVRSLITPNSRFDQYLRGNEDAIILEEKRGFELFKSYGCSSCHQGVNLGGNMRAPFGLFGNYLQDKKDKKDKTMTDRRIYNNNNQAQDQNLFRVPSLRNVELTAPYFHDGSTKTLKEAIEVMGRYMLGRDIPKSDVSLIEQFLQSLNGELNGEAL